MTCKKAIGVAEKMKEKYGGRLKLRIYTTDSKEAAPHHFKSSTNVLFKEKIVPIDIATDVNKMDAFLSSKL
jgi:hypothetical protein